MGLVSVIKRRLRLFSVVPSDTTRRRGSGHSLKSKKLLLNIIKNTSTLRMDRHQDRLTRQVVESPSFKTHKAHLNMA